MQPQTSAGFGVGLWALVLLEYSGLLAEQLFPGLVQVPGEQITELFVRISLPARFLRMVAQQQGQGIEAGRIR